MLNYNGQSTVSVNNVGGTAQQFSKRKTGAGVMQQANNVYSNNNQPQMIQIKNMQGVTASSQMHSGGRGSNGGEAKYQSIHLNN
jgi:hypothetical protein